MHCIFPAIWLILLTVSFLALASYGLSWLCFPFVLLAGLLVLSRTRRNYRILKKGRAISNYALSFLSSQLLLFYALILWIFGRSLHKWQKVEDIRKEWKTN